MTTTAQTPAMTDAPQPQLPETYDEVVARARALRPQLTDLGLAVDEHGSDPTEAMRLLGDAGLHRANIPARFGGLWDGGEFAGWDRVVETALEVTAADGSMGQCWSTSAIQAREIMNSTLPDTTKQCIADELCHEARRIVASNAETGGTGPVTGRRVEGGGSSSAASRPSTQTVVEVDATSRTWVSRCPTRTAAPRATTRSCD